MLRISINDGGLLEDHSLRVQGNVVPLSIGFEVLVIELSFLHFLDFIESFFHQLLTFRSFCQVLRDKHLLDILFLLRRSFAKSL